MKKIILLALISFSIYTVSAQNSRKEELEAMKSAFITQKMGLSTEEARMFWPVYDQMENELENLRRRRRETLLDARQNYASLGDRELEKLVDGEVIFKQQELDIIKRYHPQFKQMLPIRKVAQLYRAEEEFKRELLKRIRNRANR